MAALGSSHKVRACHSERSPGPDAPGRSEARFRDPDGVQRTLEIGESPQLSFPTLAPTTNCLDPSPATAGSG